MHCISFFCHCPIEISNSYQNINIAALKIGMHLSFSPPSIIGLEDSVDSNYANLTADWKKCSEEWLISGGLYIGYQRPSQPNSSAGFNIWGLCGLALMHLVQLLSWPKLTSPVASLNPSQVKLQHWSSEAHLLGGRLLVMGYFTTCSKCL